MKTINILGLMILWAFFGCKKDNKSSDDTVNHLLRIQTDRRNEPLELFEYNTSGELIKRVGQSTGEIASITYLNSKPVKIDIFSVTVGKIIYTYQLLYAADRVDKMMMIYTGANPNNNEPLVTWKYNYVNGLLVVAIGYGPNDNVDSYSKTTYTYYPNGDLKSLAVEECSDNSSYKLALQINYEYDSKVNPLQTAGRYLSGFSPYLHKAAHNIVKEVWMEGTNRKITQVVNREYTYQNDGYPLTSKISYHFPDDINDNYVENLNYIYSKSK